MAMKVDSKSLLSLFWATRREQNISSFDKIIENKNKKLIINIGWTSGKEGKRKTQFVI